MIKDKSFNIQKKKLGLSDNQKIKTYLAGKTIRILSDSGGHNYGTIGTEHKLGDLRSASVSTTSASYLIPNGYNILFSQFTVVTIITKADFQKEITRLKKEKKELDGKVEECQSKIDYLKETGIDEFDPDQYKALKVLELLEKPNISKLEKSKIIADLIKM